ncbi:acyl-CoA dehydrogenase family protein [Salinisphaera sp. T31B1]|uniref:acyl-CoA dehydrogenase family protein n=1 Tax=Salinisphaera sp. T31B1 TaxID=727963 RepID=UPI0033407FA2
MNAVVEGHSHGLFELVRTNDNAGFIRAGIDRLAADMAFDDPRDSVQLLALLRRLYAAGRHDLALGRLFEGHVDALQIIGRYAAATDRDRLFAAARAGALFGVWNAPLPGEPLVLEGADLCGGKAFASGAGLLDYALVTLEAGDAARAQLAAVDLNAMAPVVDRSWWDTLGMQHSETHLVRWQCAAGTGLTLIGAPGDYERQPWFSGGALRFVAVQAGGVAAVLDQVRDHLVARSRDDDAHQASRLARLYACAQASADTVYRIAEQAFDDRPTVHAARVAHARAVVAEQADRAIRLAQQSVGVQGLFREHPLCATIADLMVYLRQPGPDAQLMQVARAVAAGDLTADL